MPYVGRHAIVNLKLVDSAQAILPVNDKELHYGFCVYESLRVIEGKVVYLEEHIKRLFWSAEGLQLRHNFSEKKIASSLKILLQADHITEATITILLMGGLESRLFITAAEILKYPDSFYEEGIKVISYFGERFLPQLKVRSLLLNYLALREAGSVGAFEAILVDSKNNLLEGTRSNFFAVKNKEIYTAPSEKVLSGVTRDKVIKAATQLGYSIIYKEVKLEEVNAGLYDSSFITSTSMGVMPIKQIDSYQFSVIKDQSSSIHKLIRKWELEALH
jgi:branched-chain amino acid aminotransferase